MNINFIPELGYDAVLVTNREVSVLSKVLEHHLRKNLRKAFVTADKTNETEITEDWIEDLDHTKPLYSMVGMYKKIYPNDYVKRLCYNILKNCRK